MSNATRDPNNLTEFLAAFDDDFREPTKTQGARDVEDTISLTTLHAISAELRSQRDVKIKEQKDTMKREDDSQVFAELQKSVEEYARKLAKMTDDVWAKDLEIEELQNQLSREKKDVHRLQSELAVKAHEAQQAIQIQQAQQTKNKDEGEWPQRLQTLRDEFDRDIRQLKQSHMLERESLQETNVGLNRQIGQLTSERLKFQGDLAEFNQKVRDLEKSLRQKDQENVEAQKFQADLRLKLEGALRNSEALSGQITHLQQELEKERQRVCDLHEMVEVERRFGEESTKMISALEGRIKDQESDLESQEKIFTNRESELLERIKGLEALCSEQTAQLEQASDVVANFEEALDAGRAELQVAREESAQNLRDLDRQNTLRVDALLLQNNQLNTELSGLRSEYLSLEALLRQANEMANELRAERNQIEEEYQAKLESLIFEQRQMQDRLETQIHHSDMNQRKVQEWQTQLEARELKLRQYSEGLMKEKSEIYRLAKQLANELQMARTTHPLKDYLGITEGEIAKAQALLKNTALSSVEKTRLEDAMSKLFKKREFLNSVLLNSQKQLEDKANAVIALIQSVQP